MRNLAPLVGWFSLALLVSVAASSQDYFGIDLAITEWIQAHLIASFEGASKMVHRFGTPTWGLLEIAVVAFIFLIRKEWRHAGWAGTLVVPNLINKVLKSLIARPRPDAGLIYVAVDSASGYSFPSGHMVHFTLLLGVILYFGLLPRVAGISRILTSVSIVLILTSIGVSRVLIGVHWASDV
jgi:undecaprenyl-diphosphatase